MSEPFCDLLRGTRVLPFYNFFKLLFQIFGKNYNLSINPENFILPLYGNALWKPGYLENLLRGIYIEINFPANCL
jgi:hypothetical protein